MCGIYCLFQKQLINYELLLEWSQKTLSHRGPDITKHKCFADEQTEFRGIMIHNRLRIVGLSESCDQPMESNFGQMVDPYRWVHNGEIYNFRDLLKNDVHFYDTSAQKNNVSSCDSYSIGPSYKQHTTNLKKWYNSMDGIFSIVLFDPEKHQVIMCRDPIGVKPLFYCYIENNMTGLIERFEVSSEPKGLSLLSESINCSEKKDQNDKWTLKYGAVEPGCVYVFDFKSQRLRIEKVFEWDLSIGGSLECDTSIISDFDIIWKPLSDDLKQNCRSMIRHLLIESVWKRLECCDSDFGVLLSGGLDSSLIASIVVKLWNLKHKNKQYIPKIKTFSVGFQNESTDLVAARQISKELGTDHYEYLIPLKEGLEHVEKTIHQLDMYDVTTVRSSTPMMMMCERIKKQFPDVKVLFSGEGSDEIFAGYSYFKDYSDLKNLKQETIEKVKNLHYSDVLRCDRSGSSYGIEIRVPFLDKKFVFNMLNVIPAEYIAPTQTMEKSLLRESFDPNFIGSNSTNPHTIKCDYDTYIQNNDKVSPIVQNIYFEKDSHYLSNKYLYRVKEQFSDGVGYGWIDTLKNIAMFYCCTYVEDWEKSGVDYKPFKITENQKMDNIEWIENTSTCINIPEYYLYRNFMKTHPRHWINEFDNFEYNSNHNEFIFDRLKKITMRNWVPWSKGSIVDPSGRFQRNKKD